MPQPKLTKLGYVNEQKEFDSVSIRAADIVDSTGVSAEEHMADADKHKTYTAMTQSEASAGTAVVARSISAKVLTDTIKENIDDAKLEIETSKANIPISVTCETAAATVAKVVTITGYTPAFGDELAIKFTLGNTANSPTLNINGAGAKQFRTAAGQPTGASGIGAMYIAANHFLRVWWDGTYWCIYGSQDLTDADTVNVCNVQGALTSQYIVNNPTVSDTTQVYYPFVGLTATGTIEKVTATSSTIATTEGARTFTTIPLSLKSPIYYCSGNTTEWTAGAALTWALYIKLNIGTINWKYAIGEYYNKSGALTSNAVTTDLVQTPVYIGGTLSGNYYFIPSEYSLTLRDTAKVYKQIGGYNTAGSFHLSEYQPVYVYKNNAWIDMSAIVSATSATEGVVKTASDTVQTVAANAVTETASRTYGVQKNAAGQAVVNVPWTDTNTYVADNTVYTVTTNTTGHRIKTNIAKTEIGSISLEFKGYGYTSQYCIYDTIVDCFVTSTGVAANSAQQLNKGRALRQAMIYVDTDDTWTIYLGGTTQYTRVNATATFIASTNATTAAAYSAVPLPNRVTGIAYRRAANGEEPTGSETFYTIVADSRLYNCVLPTDLNKVVYVATGNGDDSAWSPSNQTRAYSFKTIARALSAVPKSANVTFVINKSKTAITGIGTAAIAAYAAATAYVVGNKCTYGGYVYECVADVTGTAPTIAMTTPWKHVNLATTSKGAYESETAYALGDTVTYNGLSYVCIKAGTGVTPTTAFVGNWRVCGEHNPIVTESTPSLSYFGLLAISTSELVEVIFLNGLTVLYNRSVVSETPIVIAGTLSCSSNGYVRFLGAMVAGNIFMYYTGAARFAGTVTVLSYIEHLLCPAIEYNSTVTILSTDTVSRVGITATQNTRLFLSGTVNINGFSGANTGSGISAELGSTVILYGTCTISGFKAQIQATTGGTVENNATLVLSKGAGNTGAAVNAILVATKSKFINNKGMTITRNDSLTDSISATGAFLDLGNIAPLASPVLTGTPTAPTAVAGTNNTQIATTAFVKAAVPEAMTQAEADAGTATTARSITAKVLADTIQGKATTLDDMTQAEAIAGTETTARSISAKVLVDTIEEKSKDYDAMAYVEAIAGTETTARVITAKVLVDTIKEISPFDPIHAFDDWTELVGYTLTIDTSAASSVTETLKKGSTTAAVRVTTFNANGSISIIFTAGSYTATKTITFNGNVITEAIA